MVMDGRRLDRILITKLPSADDVKEKEVLKTKDRCSGGLFVCGEKAT